MSTLGNGLQSALTTYPGIERSASERRGDEAPASVKAVRAQGKEIPSPPLVFGMDAACRANRSGRTKANQTTPGMQRFLSRLAPRSECVPEKSELRHSSRTADDQPLPPNLNTVSGWTGCSRTVLGFGFRYSSALCSSCLPSASVKDGEQYRPMARPV
jgi:hypothetical protein